MSKSRRDFNRTFLNTTNPKYLIDYPFFHYIFKGKDGLPKTVNVIGTMMNYMERALKGDKRVYYFNYYGIWSSFMNSTKYFYIATYSRYRPTHLIPHVRHERYKFELKQMAYQLQKIERPETKFVDFQKCCFDVWLVICGLIFKTNNDNIDTIILRYAGLHNKCFNSKIGSTKKSTGKKHKFTKK